MTSSRCGAKNRAYCRYHGTQSASVVRVLRDKVKVAHSVYSASKDSDLNAQWEAYANVREAEIGYYATDEGQDALKVAIDNSQSEDHRTMLLDIQAKSNELRTKNENTDSDGATMWGPPVKVAKPALPKPTQLSGGLNDKGQAIHTISSGKTPDGVVFDFRWNAATGEMSYGEFDELGNEDMDSVRYFRKIESQQKAIEIATKWYQTSVIR